MEALSSKARDFHLNDKTQSKVDVAGIQRVPFIDTGRPASQSDYLFGIDFAIV